MRRSFTGALITMTLVGAGCSDPSPPPGAAPAPAGQASSPKEYKVEELPAVGERLTPLDQGRVEFAPPKGWHVMRRDSKHLAWFVKGDDHDSLPRITVSVMPALETADVTEENAAAFAKQRQASLERFRGRQILEPCRPIVLGDHVWSRHVRYVEKDRQPVVLQSLETARGGRLYTIELLNWTAGKTNQDFAKSIMEYRDEGYAVAANWKFLKESSQSAEPTVAAEGGAESPETPGKEASGETGSNEETSQPEN